jgi:hypothetical protein
VSDVTRILNAIGAGESHAAQRLLPIVYALDEALEKLQLEDQAKADLVKLRFFAGLTVEQAAEAGCE